MSDHNSTIKRLIPKFKAITGSAYTLTTKAELMTYELDACMLITKRPDIVVLPNSTQQVSDILKLCHQHHIPFVARGSGTGLSGGALPAEGGVIVGLNRMNHIRDIDTTNAVALVETGVINASLNKKLAHHGLFYAPDPSSQSACTLGGNIAENAGGIHCIKYGVTTDHILALEVVLPNGDITWFGSDNRRSHGLNLSGLFTGSEGTFGIATQAKVKLTKKPEHIKVFLAGFTQTKHATDAVSDIIKQGPLPSALEFMDTFTVKAVNDAFHVGFPEDCEAVLLIELDGSQEYVAHNETQLKTILNAHELHHLQEGNSEAERLSLWKARKLAVAAYGRYLPAFYLHDTVIPRSKLSEVLEKINALGTQYQMTIGNVFHAGDGNLHPNILFDPDDTEMMERVLKGGEEILKVCLAAGGTLSGEHGIGLEKSEYMDLIFDEQDLAKMKTIRLAFDPEHLANPGKIFPHRSGCGETHAKNAQTPTSQKSPTLTTAGVNAPHHESENQEGLWI